MELCSWINFSTTAPPLTNDLNTVIRLTDAEIVKVYIPDTKKQFKRLKN